LDNILANQGLSLKLGSFSVARASANKKSFRCFYYVKGQKKILNTVNSKRQIKKNQ